MKMTQLFQVVDSGSSYFWPPDVTRQNCVEKLRVMKPFFDISFRSFRELYLSIATQQIKVRITAFIVLTEGDTKEETRPEWTRLNRI